MSPKRIYMTYGVILAAGSGKRMKTKQKKQFISINKKPILYYSLEKFLKIKKFDVIIIVINKEDEKNKVIIDLLKKYNKQIQRNKLYIVLGGKERYDSVFNAISFINDIYGINKNDKVLIHDSARPNVNVDDINSLIKTLNKFKAITLGYKLSDSIKQIKKSNLKKYATISPVGEDIIRPKEVIKSLNREEYYLITTPQGFNLKILYDAYQKFLRNKKKYKITDDLQMIEYFSKFKTYILDSSKLNYKITIQEDLNVVKYLL